MTRLERVTDGALRRLGTTVLVGLIVFMLIPVVVVTVLSFSNEPFLHFPPGAWGLRQYEALAESPYWLHAVWESFTIATPTAILATLIGLPAVLALNRTDLPLRGVLWLVGISPLVIPGVAYAVAMYTFYARVRLLGSAMGLILAHTALALPFVIVMVGSAVNRIPRELELVAMTLGASRARATTGITLRLLLPAIGAAFVFAFLASFDEAVFVNFVGGPGLVTLPKAIYDSVLTGIDPLITAIATLFMACSGIVMALAVYWRSE